jgi:hypothetical protein
VTPVAPAKPASPAVSASLQAAVGNTGMGNLRAPAHDPFVQPPVPTPPTPKTTITASGHATPLGQGVAVPTASAGTASAAHSPTTPARTAAPVHTAPVRTVTVTVPAPTRPPSKPSLPKPVYASYDVSVRFGAAGERLRTYRGLRRFQLLPRTGTVIAFLGVEHDGQTAVFVVPPSVTPAGEARCTPSADQCRFLQMRPGSAVLLLARNANGTSSEYELRYVSVAKRRASHPVRAAVDRLGARLILWAARVIRPLETMRYSEVDGHLSIHLARSVPIAHQVLALEGR